MKIKIAELKQDDTILELRPVNPVFVSRYRQAMRNGDVFPKITVDADNTIISGYHRYNAYLEEYGDSHEIDVIKVAFKSEAERIEYAVKDNSKHGNPLDGITRRRVVLKLTELGREPEAIAKLLGVAVKRIDELAGFSVVVRGKDGRNEHKAIKRGLEHISGTSVKKQAYEEHSKRDLGIPAKQAANQLIRWIRNDWIDRSNEETANVLAELKAELEGWLKE